MSQVGVVLDKLRLAQREKKNFSEEKVARYRPQTLVSDGTVTETEMWILDFNRPYTMAPSENERNSLDKALRRKLNTLRVYTKRNKNQELRSLNCITTS